MDRKITFTPLFKKMLDLKMSKTELAEKVGLSRNTVAKMAKDEYVSLEVVERIAIKLDLPLNDIIDMISQ